MGTCCENGGRKRMMFKWLNWLPWLGQRTELVAPPSLAGEVELAERLRKCNRQEARLRKWEEELETREQLVEEREGVTQEEERRLRQLVRVYRRKLEQSSSLSLSEVLNQLRAEILKDHQEELLEYRRTLKRKDELEYEEEARRMLLDVLPRIGGDLSPPLLYTVVPLPDATFKGMIIGREGRNSRVFEAKTGVSLTVEEDENAVTLTHFDPARREVARLALDSLIRGRRISPQVIETAVEEADKRFEGLVERRGEKVLEELDLPPMDREICRLLGHLEYRLTRGQNTLVHSMEVARCCSYLAAEMGLDPVPARLAGLFHDIGKAMKGGVDYSHARAGARLLEINGACSEVVNAIAAHHQEVDETSFYASIVKLADSLSAAREGARSSSYGDLAQRLQNLEAIARSMPEVKDVMAFRAGRELRISVCPEKVDDLEVRRIANRVRSAIEEGTQYNGDPVRITVLREVRHTETTAR